MANVHTSDRGMAAEQERRYREHNVTRRFGDGSRPVSGRPNECDQQCQCDDCNGHRRRASQTGVASPRKDI